MGASGNHNGTQGSSSRRVQVVSEYTDETMTRAAREERIAWRLRNLAEWRRGLLSLGHYRAEYPYDVAHEYDYDWTTDSDYVWTKVHRREYDEDGHEFLRLRDTFFLWETERTSLDRLGNRVVVKPDVYFDEDVAARLNLFTRQGSPKNVTAPDLVVLLPECELPRGEWRPLNDCVFRLGLGDPAPELVLQHLSTTVDWQRNSKLRLYEALGVIEYLVYDPGDMREPGSPVGLVAHRLEDGVYRVVRPDSNLSEPDLPAIESKVFGTHIRIDPNPAYRSSPHMNGPRFQWYDTVEKRWRDHETDQQVRHERSLEVARTRGRALGQTDVAIEFLHAWLEAELELNVRDHVAAFWRKHGLPEDFAAKIVAVMQTPNQWPFLLLDPPVSQDGDDAAETDSTNGRQETDRVTFRRRGRGGGAIEHLHVLLYVELEPKVRERVAAVWREEGPPDDWFDKIKAVQRSPRDWFALLVEPVALRKQSADRGRASS